MHFSSRTLALLVFLSVVTPVFGGMRTRLEDRQLDTLTQPRAAGARVRLDGIAVGDRVLRLDLERFDVWAPNAEIVADNGSRGVERLPVPAVQYYRGTVDGKPDSMVMIAVARDGSASGLLVSEDVRYTIATRAKRDVTIDEADLLDDYPIDGSFACDLDRASLRHSQGVPSVRTDAVAVADGTLSGTSTWTLNLAVETDYELFQDMGSSAGNVTTFIGNVVAAASTIYKRDLSTDLLLSYLRVQTGVSDPFTVNPGAVGTWNGASTTYTTLHALAELGDIWANAGTRPFSGPRSSVILMSGKLQTAGVAWIGTACGSDFYCSGGNCGSPMFDGHTGGAYAYIGLGNPSQTVPDPNATVNGIQYGLGSNYWPVLGMAHELGHNVDGDHTHCISLSAQQKASYGVTRNFVDECYNGQGGCSSAPQTVPAEKGTIMSYCHLLGSSQSRFVFGTDGQPNELSRNQIRTYIDSKTPNAPGITAPATVNAGANANASVTSPSGTLTYEWSITNGSIVGSTSGSTITFTGAANPVTLKVRATNGSGCSATETRAVTVNSCVAPAITSVSPSLTLTSGSSVSLSATASGSATVTYQWFAGSVGNTSNPAGTGASISIAPSSTTSYWVRATNGCGSADSSAVVVKVVDAPLTAAALYVIQPCRLLDTRYSGGALADGATRTVQVTGVCGVPAGARSVVANITAVSPASAGELRVFPSTITWPGTSNMSYRSGRTRASYSQLTLSAAGAVNVQNSGSALNFIIDVTGYYN